MDQDHSKRNLILLYQLLLNITKRTHGSLKKPNLKWYSQGSKSEDSKRNWYRSIFAAKAECIYEPMRNSPPIFQTEVYAIDYRYVQFNHERNYRGQNIAILPDSQPAIEALNSNIIYSKMVWKFLNDFNRQQSGEE